MGPAVLGPYVEGAYRAKAGAGLAHWEEVGMKASGTDEADWLRGGRADLEGCAYGGVAGGADLVGVGVD
jgi:hypothetical protein